jgi:acyl-CoA synthetase (AMP-forming)/AMP-acid ligase II
MSESASLVWAYSLREDIGKVLPYRKLFSSNDKLFISGKTLFSGYIEEDGTISSPLIDGAFETPDRGLFDEATEMLTIYGRSDDIFLFGGENISTKELEESIAKIPGITLAIVTPLTSTQYGHVPLAIIVTGIKGDLSSWKERFATVLPKVKMPKAIVILEKFIYSDEPDAKQRLSKLKKEITSKLASFEDLPADGMVQMWPS